MKAFKTQYLTIGVLALLLAQGTFAGAETNSQIRLPEFQKQALLNGMEILSLTTQKQRVPFVLMIKNGAAFDPIEKWGVTYLMTRMMLEGTQTSSGSQLRQDLESLDAQIETRVGWDAIFFVGSAPVGHIAQTLNLLGDIVVRPQFEEHVFDEVRSQVLQEIKEDQEQIETATEDLLISRIFRNNPYEHSIEGTSETLGNTFLVDVKIQYRRLFMPNQALLAFYHSEDPEAIFTSLSRYWGSWVRGRPAPFTFRPAAPVQGREALLVNAQSKDSMFRWGKLGVTRDAREYYPLKVFEQYVMLSFPEWADDIASESQIQASAAVAARKMPGYIEISIQAPPAFLPDYYRRFQSLLKDLGEGNIDVERFAKAKKLALSEFVNAIDTPASFLYEFLESDLYNVGVNYLINYGLRLERVSPDDFKSAVQEYLSPDSYVIIVAGPSTQLEPHMDQFGDLKILN